MPTTYAHWRFGNVSLNSLDEKYKTIINKYRSLFDIGVHGPDIFFYYNALKHNDVNRYGSRMHDTSMKQLLEGFRKVYQKAENREASLWQALPLHPSRKPSQVFHFPGYM